MNKTKTPAPKADILRNVKRTWRKYGTYANPNTAVAIATMLRNSGRPNYPGRSGAVEAYPPGTFEAERRGTEVWVRRAK